MIFNKQKINGVYLIKPELFVDNRGLFRRHFCENEFSAMGLMTDIKQSNISENKFKHTLRGFHFQYPPHGENKVISCIKGSIYNVVIDLRRECESFLQWEAFELNEENRLSLHVPKGCANAYLTLHDNTWVLYYHSEFYSPGSEGAIRFDDSYFNIPWPAEPKVISEKDLAYPDFNPDTDTIIS